MNNSTTDKIKVSDYVAAFLSDKGIRHVFGLTGGAVVHLFDSLAKQNNIQPIFPHHEQAASFAAVAYGRYSGLGACIVTTGPGGTNALTGLLGAWQDSIPCIFISGNARRDHLSHNRSCRQVGTQEFDIVSHVKDLTKYAAVVETPESTPEILNKAWMAAISGRPGPVWVDIPVDIQWSEVAPYDPSKNEPSTLPNPRKPEPDNIKIVCDLIQSSERPVFLIGYGVHLGHAEERVRALAEKLDIPVICSWTASDIFPSSHDLYTGIPGISGQRGGNLAMQNADLLIALGSHLCFPITGGNFEAFAREAKVVVVDIDPVELEPYTVRIDHPILSDVGEFCSEFMEAVDFSSLPDISGWRDKCRIYKSLNEIPEDRYKQTDYLDPCVFMAELSNSLQDQPIVVDGGGTSLYASFQALKTQENQRLLCASAISAMGTGLPDSIGVSFASENTVICTIGDGSMQLNIQELQTIKTHNLPIKIIILNNQGYLAMRHTQDEFLGERHVGSSAEGGLSLPSYEQISKAYGLNYMQLRKNSEIPGGIKNLLSQSGPVVCELFVDPNGQNLFSQGFRETSPGTFKALAIEDMQPLLPRDQFMDLMEIEPWEGS